MALTAIQTGAAGEAAVAAAFLRHGIPVYLPLGDEGVDLVADFGDRPQRIQVKTCISSAPTVRFRLTRRVGVRASDGRACQTAYEEGQVDWFALYAMAHDRIMLVRPSGAATQAVRFLPGGNYQWQQSGIMDADECDLGAVLARIYEET